VRKSSCSLSLRSLFQTAPQPRQTAVGGGGAQHWSRRGWALTNTGRNSCYNVSLKIIYIFNINNNNLKISEKFFIFKVIIFLLI